MENSKLQRLTEIFNEKIFRIPDFQRGYSCMNMSLNCNKKLTEMKK